MAVIQISDVVVPEEFTAYQIENSLVSTALFRSGVVAKNGLIAVHLQAGAESFNIPFWADLGESEADITSDDPTVLSTPLKIGAAKQVVRKSFLHQSWSEMSLASELSGDNALERIPKPSRCLLGSPVGAAAYRFIAWRSCVERREQC